MAVSWLLPDEAATMRAAIVRRLLYETWERLQDEGWMPAEVDDGLAFARARLACALRDADAV